MTMSIAQSISSTSGTTATAQEYVEAKKKEDPLGRDAFLTMLVAQMEHQNPLSPLDGTDFTAQLAQFSSLEQETKMNDNLESILTSLDSKSETSNLLDYIGKDASAKNNVVTVTSGKASVPSYTAEGKGEVEISIFDSNGREIRNIYPGEMAAGKHEVKWDGKDNSGAKVMDGTYTYTVSSTNKNGASVPVNTMITGKVTGLTYENGTPYLVMNDLLVDPSTVLEVSLPEDE